MQWIADQRLILSRDNSTSTILELRERLVPQAVNLESDNKSTVEELEALERVC